MSGYNVLPGTWRESYEIMWEFIDSRLDKSVDESEDEAKIKFWLRLLDEGTLNHIAAYCGYYDLGAPRKDLETKLLPYLLQTLEEERCDVFFFSNW